MSEPALTDRLQAGLDLHRQGDLAGAQAQYEQILTLAPEHADALHLTGLVAHQLGHSDLAVPLMQRALVQQPESVVFLNNLGEALSALARWDDAFDCYRQAAVLQPGNMAVWTKLAKTLVQAGNAAGAVEVYQLALEANPASAVIRSDWASHLLDLGQIGAAETLLRAACALEADCIPALVNLGYLLRLRGDASGARGVLEQAVVLAPNNPAARINLGLACLDLGEPRQALDHYRQGLVHAPSDSGLLNAAGVALQALSQPSEAEACYRQALASDTANPEARNNLATLLLEQGYQAQALAEFDAVIASRPDYLNAASNRLMALCYLTEDARALAAAHETFGRLFPQVANGPDRKAGAVLRIGFVSGDLSQHPLVYFLEPLLEHLDRTQCRLFAYHAGPTEDATSLRLKALFDGWRAIARQSDDAVAGWIGEDGIDVLVDLSVHSALNRLPLLARKPAPVQLSWLGYPGPTGLASMDGLLVDAILAPLGEPVYGSEVPLRLPAYRPYRAPGEAPAVSPSPYRNNGHVTFASLNGFAKVTPAMLVLWAQILAAAPTARLLFAAAPGPRRRAEVEALFGEYGVARERLEWMERSSLPDYLAQHGRIDVALDTFPFNGGTTSFHAVWMGVPVISLRGETMPSRAGASLLLPLGLADWVAEDRNSYLRMALDIAADPCRLDDLRAGLRQRLADSAHGDAAGFGCAFLSICRNLAR